MRSLLKTIAAVVVLVAATASAAQEPGRIALVIGNQGYNDKVGPLRNPHNDMGLVGKALGDVGFTLAKPIKDATREDMLLAVHDLAARLRDAGRGAVGFFYYTGHGVSVGGDNVLIPTNAEGTGDADLSVRGVKLADVLDILQREAPDAVHFVVLDACRNNIRGRRGAKGFVPVGDQRTGIVIAFATAAGQTASDEGAVSGPYAAALAEEIVKPGRTDQAVFNAVRSRVAAATRTQIPWTHDGLVGERVVFKAVAPFRQPAPPASDVGTALETVRICREVESMTSISMLGVLERQHKGTPAGDCVALRIEELKKVQAAAKAEEERQRAEAARKMIEDEARAKAEAERRHLAMLQQ